MGGGGGGGDGSPGNNICLRAKRLGQSGDAQGIAWTNSAPRNAEGYSNLYYAVQAPVTATGQGSHDYEGWMPLANQTGDNYRIPWSTVNNSDSGNTKVTGIQDTGTHDGSSGYYLRFQHGLEGGTERYTNDYNGDTAHILCKAKANTIWHMGGYVKTEQANDDMDFFIFAVDSDGDVDFDEDSATFPNGWTASGYDGTTIHSTQASPFYESSARFHQIRLRNVGTTWRYWDTYIKLGSSTDIAGITVRWDMNSGASGEWGQIDQWFLKPIHVSFNNAVGNNGSNQIKFSEYD